MSAPAADEPTVVLIAADGTRLTVSRRTASVSGLLRTLLSQAASVEAARGEVSLPEISREALERCIAFMEYKRAHAGARGAIPHFDIPPEAALELLVAANYLSL